MKHIFIFSFMILNILYSQQYQSQEYEDVLYLKNGTIIHGMIIEQIPNGHIKIKSGSNVFVYQISDVEKITKEAKVNSYNNSGNNSTDCYHRGIMDGSSSGGAVPSFLVGGLL